jgi:MYXO-CTERM domain-containing protein
MVLRDGSLKPHGLALKNVIALLNDPGADFAPTALDFEIESQASLVDDHNFKTPEIHHLLLKKRNGVFYLVLWNEALSYDNLTEQDVVIADQEVKLTLQTPITMARTLRPLEGTTATATFLNPTALTLQVPDHPLIVELTPRDAAPPDGSGGVAGGSGGSSAAGTPASIGGATIGGNDNAAGTQSMGGTPVVTNQSSTAGSGTSTGGLASGASRVADQDAAGCGCHTARTKTSHEWWWALSLLTATRFRRRASGRTSRRKIRAR